ncbi:hypothetical protein HDZ31DRAFT_63496 [Schizophyllum fasciatum]
MMPVNDDDSEGISDLEHVSALHPGIDPKYLGLRYQTPSPSDGTPDDRPRYLRNKIIAIIGYAVCLFTGMIPSLYLLECMHIVPRSLQTTHMVIYFCFQEAIGIVVNNKRVLNLDHFGNVDLGLKWLHALFDGPSVKTDEYGHGEIALVPTDLPLHVQWIKDNWGKDYNALYPQLMHTYEVFGFPDPDYDQTSWGLYPTPARTYSHLTSEQRARLERELDAEGVDGQNGDLLTEDGVREARPPRASKAAPTNHDLKPGYQGYTVISHVKPVFAIFDYIMKLKFRLFDNPHLRRQVPVKDAMYFWNVLWPTFHSWFEPTPEVLLRIKLEVDHADGLKRKDVQQGPRRAQTTGARRAEPMAPTPVRRPYTHTGIASASSTSDSSSASEYFPSKAAERLERAKSPARATPASRTSKRRLRDDTAAEDSAPLPLSLYRTHGTTHDAGTVSSDADEAPTPKPLVVELPALKNITPRSDSEDVLSECTAVPIPKALQFPPHPSASAPPAARVDAVPSDQAAQVAHGDDNQPDIGQEQTTSSSASTAVPVRRLRSRDGKGKVQKRSIADASVGDSHQIELPKAKKAKGRGRR